MIPDPDTHSQNTAATEAPPGATPADEPSAGAQGERMARRIRDARDLAELADLFSDWGRLSVWWGDYCRREITARAAEYNAASPQQLDYLEVESGGVDYRVYGVIHGWTGGSSDEYRRLVTDGIKKEPDILYEKMLGRFYGAGGQMVQMPDFCMLGRLGQFVLGLRVMLIWPLFVLLAGWDILRELFSRRSTEDAAHYNNVYYHNIDPELRRGLDGALPAPLQGEYEFSHWRRWRGYANAELLLAVAPRSAYMAEFAREWARSKGLAQLALVVGDRHLTEVAHYLRTPPEDSWLRHAAAVHARRLAGWRGWYGIMFAGYFCMLLLGALFGALPWLALLVWLQLG